MIFVQVTRWVLKYRSSKNPLIQMAILNLIPRLAAFQPHLFTGEPGEIDSCSNILHVTLGIDLLYMVLVKVLEMLELERKR